MLINSPCGMKCKAHGAQEPKHIRNMLRLRAPRNAAIRPHSELISVSLAQVVMLRDSLKRLYDKREKIMALVEEEYWKNNKTL